MPYWIATENTKQNILDAFWQLYCRQKGLKGVTVKEIVALAGYTRPTFYEYFTGVADALRQLEERLIPTEQLLRLQLRLLTADMSAGALLSELDSLFCAQYDKLAVLLGEDGDPAFAGQLAAALRPCARAWLSRSCALPSEAEEAVAEGLLCGLGGLFCSRYAQGAQSPLLLLADWLALMGERPRKSVKYI